MKKITRSIIVLVLLLSQLSLVHANPMNLYTINPAIQSRTDASTPFNQSVEEWNIQFEVAQITQANKRLHLQVPYGKKGLLQLTAVQTTTALYPNGNFQWAGTLYDTANQSVGDVLINIIDGQAFGLMMFGGLSYEIYSHPQLGTRLARTESKASTMQDLLKEELDAVIQPPVSKQTTQGKGGGSPGVAVVDVLVVIDDDLIYPGTPIFGKIQNEKMNADYILNNSGPNGIGVPVRLNLLPYQTINVPPQHQNITFVDGELQSYNHMTDEQSALSLSLMQLQDTHGADYVALYIPFDPDVLGEQACGVASIPRYNFQDRNDFRFSFSLHASTCNADQFVFIHELLHNFGSAHVGGNLVYFEPHARGYDVWGSVDGDFSTLMGCTQTTGSDPSDFTCNRIPQLSSPDVMVSGQPIGRVVGNPSSSFNADNVKFLTECAGFDPVTLEVTEPCRRFQMATKRTNTNPVDTAPALAITSPIDNQLIEPTSAFVLTATVSDDVGLNTASWLVFDMDANPPVLVDSINLSVSGTQPNINVSTAAFQNPGNYLVTVAVEDTVGQQVSDSHQLTVDADDLPVVSITNPGEGQYFPIGQQVVLQAGVVDDNPINQVSWTVYEQNQNQVLESGIGTDAQFTYLTQAITNPGLYLIEAVVTDSAGQQASAWGSFNIDDIPQVSITDPAAAALLVATGGNHTLRATATDDRGPVSVFWEVINAYTDEVLDSGLSQRTQFSFVTPALSESGHYVIRATASDVLGQSSSDAIIIEVINSADVQSSFSFVGKEPLLKATLSNHSDIDAQSVRFRVGAFKKDNVVGRADTSQVPAECRQLSVKEMAMLDPSLIIMYECHLTGLGVFDFDFNWDLICLDTPGAGLTFATKLLSINGVSTQNGSSDSNVTYYHPVCNF